MKTAGDIVQDKQCEIVSISHDQTIQHACRDMLDKKIGAIVIKKNDDYVGIWSERDLLRNIANPEFDPHTARIEDYMNAPLHKVAHDTPLHKLTEMFLGLFVRHLLVEKDGETVGLISIGDVLRANLLEKEKQFKELNAFVSWDYYENWKWGRKKKK